MKVTVCFGRTGIVVPVKDGRLRVRELTRQALQRYLKTRDQDYYLATRLKGDFCPLKSRPAEPPWSERADWHREYPFGSYNLSREVFSWGIGLQRRWKDAAR